MDKIEKTRLTDALQSSIVQLCKNAIRGCDLLCPDVEIDGLVCISVGDTEVVVKVHQKSIIEDESTDTAEEEAADSKVKRRKKRPPRNRRRACSNRLEVVKVDPQRHLPCTQCDVTFEAYPDFKEHNWKVHQCHTCNHCHLTFQTAEELNDHARSPCHVQPLSPPKNFLKCGVCAIESVTIEHLVTHLQQEHLFSKVLQCSLCNVYFPDMESFNEHNSNEHITMDTDQVKTIITADDPTPPETDAIVLSPEKDSKITTKMNTGEPILFKCPICHSLESSISAYREHQQNSHNRVICHVCCHSFSAKRKLTRHFNIHLRKMPFSCEQCSLRFNKQEEMDRHIDGNFCRPK